MLFVKRGPKEGKKGGGDKKNVGKTKMTAATVTDPSKVVASGEGLTFGYINHSIEAMIDTRGAGPGELTVYCEGPENNAFCELRDHKDGTFTLVMQAQDVGNHELHVKYDNQPIPGSPFTMRVSPAGLVKVRGPGLDDGTLHSYQGERGEFIVDTHDAGPGEIKLRVGGPRGAFKVKTRKVNRNLVCRYDPRDPGVYLVHVFWSGDHVPGSPFRVYIARDSADLARYQQSKQQQQLQQQQHIATTQM